MSSVENKLSALELDDIAKQLLQDRYLLTALELYTEALETGREIPLLRDYFSNPANFELCPKNPSEFISPSTSSLNRTSSQTTLDSLDWARYSEDGERAQDDKIAIVEFELRKAQKTIQSLRDNLTQATAASEIGSELKTSSPDKSAAATAGELKPHEALALNFLVNEYLVTRNYKMTANTFADENDNEDFENWDDVGLNIPRPPTLIQWLQEKVPGLCPKASASTQTESSEHHSEELLALREHHSVELLALREHHSKELLALSEHHSEELLALRENYSEELLALRERVNELEALCSKQNSELRELSKGSFSAVSIQVEKSSRNLVDEPQEQVKPDREDIVEVTKTGVKYARKSNVSSCQDNSGHSYHIASVHDNARDASEKSGQLQRSDQLLTEHENNEIPDIGEFQSIEDCIENPSNNRITLYETVSSSLAEPGPVQDKTDSSSDTTNEIGYVGVNSEMDLTQESPINLVEHHDQGVLISGHGTLTINTSDIMDPQKCDRLPPLGASSESSPQGILPGEFVSAQREEAKSLLRSAAVREVPDFLESRVFSVTFGSASEVDSRLQNELAALSLGRGDLLTLVASSLHNIAPNVILAKREELLPLLVYSINNHSDLKERERLLHLLFNLTKKPDKEQRGAILLGLMSLARMLGPEKIEAELLPQCWEQLSHKHLERRLLVAQSVAVLAPYTPPSLRNSLLLSMLLQLLGVGGEKEMVVREAALASLSLLVMYLDDLDKMQSLVNCLLVCLEYNASAGSDIKQDGCESSNVFLLLSSLAHWSVKAQCLSNLIYPLIERLECITLQIKEDCADPNKANKVNLLYQCLNSLMKGLNASVPYLFLSLSKSCYIEARASLASNAVRLSSPVSLSFVDELNAILDSNLYAESLLNDLHNKIAKVEVDSWSELKYVSDVVVPRIIAVTCNVHASKKEVIRSCITFFSRLCFALGLKFKGDVLSPLFVQSLNDDSSHLPNNLSSSTINSALFVIYTVAILGDPNDARSEELQKFLADQIANSAVAGSSTQEALELSISLLIEKPHSHDDVLGALWASIVHRLPVVRICSASLWILLVGRVKEAELASRVIPALVTLATDTEVSVRASAVAPLVYVIDNSVGKEVKDKVTLQLESVCDEANVMESSALQMSIVRTCSFMGPNMPSQVLHNLFLPLLCRVALDGQGSPQERLEFGTALLEALTALASCPMPDHVVAHFVLPSLNQLQKTLGVISFEHMETITVLTKEYTLRAQSSTPDKIRSSISTGSLSSIGSSFSHSVGAMGAGLSPGVEDMKNKMTKMFSQSGKSGTSGGRTGTTGFPKSPSVNITSLFKKK